MAEEEQNMLKQIMPSILASLCVALVMGFITFVGTLSRMNTMFEVTERRLSILESDAKAHEKASQQLQISLTKSQVLLERITDEMKALRIEMPQHKTSGGLQ